MGNLKPVLVTDQILCRVRGEYLEMPGLRLTQKQAQRLLGLDEATCAELLEFLVESKFLDRSGSDSYVRRSAGAEAFPAVRMARAPLQGTTPQAVANRARRP